MAETVLDLSGLKCPLPAMATKRALKTLGPRETLIVIATDPLAGVDIPNAAREAGCRIEEQTREEGRQTFRIAAAG